RPVGVAGFVGPKPVAKAIRVSPGLAGRAAVTRTFLEVSTFAGPVPAPPCVKNAGAYVASVRLNGEEVAPPTVTVRVVAPGETSEGICTLSCVGVTPLGNT